MRHRALIFAALLGTCLTSCVTSSEFLKSETIAEEGVAVDVKTKLMSPSEVFGKGESGPLTSWWSFFNDPVLTKLVGSALSLNQKIAQEATNSAVNITDPHSALALSVTDIYIEYRLIQSQYKLLSDYLAAKSGDLVMEEKKHDLLLKQESLQRVKLKDAELRLARQTKLLPEFISQILKENSGLPDADITPVLASPSEILMREKDLAPICVAFLQEHQGAITKDDLAHVFTRQTLGNFFGISDEVFINPDMQWNVALGHSTQAAYFQHLEDKTSDKVSVVNFQNEVLSHLLDIEYELVSFSHMQEQYIVLDNARHQAGLTVDEAYNTELSALKAKYEKTKMLVELYKRLTAY